MTHRIDFSALAARFVHHATSRRPHIVGITGSVAVGKTSFAQGVAAALPAGYRVETISTDGFLLPNAALDARGLTLRKGFPESYDAVALGTVLAQLRRGHAVVPGYSHVTYDIDPALARAVGPVDLVLVEGLALVPPPSAIDLLIYLDAAETDLEAWYVERFLRLCDAAATQPESFYARFCGLDSAHIADFARQVWTSINLPNLRDHIAAGRDLANIVITKARDHSMVLTRG